MNKCKKQNKTNQKNKEDIFFLLSLPPLTQVYKNTFLTPKLVVTVKVRKSLLSKIHVRDSGKKEERKERINE